MNHEWLLDEIASGLQRLYCLSLDRTPAAEMLEGTARAWLEAVGEGRDWEEERDAHRIRAAFVTLSHTRESWPAPRHFLDALPRVEQRAIAQDVTPATPEQARAALAKIRQMLENEPMPTFKPETARTGPARAEVERELSKHYADRKTAAAGGDA